jgi:hypothetical protein
MESKDNIDMGDMAKDELTGFEGVVIGRTHWLTNCDRITLQPRSLDKDGQPTKSNSFDITHCSLIAKAVIKQDKHNGDQHPEIALGDVAKDSITGFEGRGYRARDLVRGCRPHRLAARSAQGWATAEERGFDAPNCVLVSKKNPPAPKEHRGGPMDEVRRSADPTR